MNAFGLGVALFDDERSDVVPSLIVVFRVGPVTVRELQPQLHFRRKNTVALIRLTFYT